MHVDTDKLVVLIILQFFLHTLIIYFIVLTETTVFIRFKFLVLNFFFFVIFFIMLYFLLNWIVNSLWVLLQLFLYIYISYKNWNIVKRGLK